MIVGPATQRPMILAFALFDWQIIDACDAQTHQPVLIELPVFVAIAAEPMAAIIVPLVSETNRDSILAERPNLLDQAVMKLAIPLTCEKCLDFCSTLDKLSTIAPATVGRIGKRDLGWIARVPCIFRHSHLLRGALGGEGGQRRAIHLGTSLISRALQRCRRAGHSDPLLVDVALCDRISCRSSLQLVELMDGKPRIRAHEVYMFHGH